MKIGAKLFGIGAAILFLLLTLTPTTIAVDEADEVIFDDNTKPVEGGPGDDNGIIQIFETIGNTMITLYRRLMKDYPDVLMGASL